MLDNAFVRIGDTPELGRARPELRLGLRSHSCEAHVIFYRQAEDSTEILRILHGARDVRRIRFA